MNEQDAQAAALDAYLNRAFDKATETSGSVAVFRAVPGPYLEGLKPAASIRCIQTYKPLADELCRTGYQVVADCTAPIQLAIVFATKHKEEVFYHIAQAVEALEEGGTLIVSAANDLGAASLERRCAELLGGVESYSKHKCRVFRATKDTARLNPDALAAWRRGGEMRRVAETGLYACPGLFSWKAIDAGSRLLAAHLPADLSGRGADLGAGYGYLSREALARAPGIKELHLFEAERKALEAAERNLADCREGVTLHYHWADATLGLPLAGFDFVIMNPPFHTGRGALLALGRAFVRRALEALKPGGRLFMVANRRLPYEFEIPALYGEIVSSVQENGFKVIVASKLG